MKSGLEGKVVAVTGAARGIGAEIARVFASEGAKVLCLDVRTEDLVETVEGIVTDGGSAEALTTDITDRTAVHSVVTSAEERHGRLDVIVNNAAWARFQPLADIDETTLDRVLATGLKSMIWMAQAAAPAMARAGGGAIVNISSLAAVRAIPNSAAYCAVKAAVAGLTRQLAVDLAADGTRVNAIAPGFIETPVAIRNVGEAGIAQRLASTPLGRLGRTSDIADLALYLASSRAAFITGEVILADGGRANAAL